MARKHRKTRPKHPKLMADLDTIFPDHGDAEHNDLEYIPAETLHIDGPAPNHKLVQLQIVALKAESTYAQVAQDVQNEEYDFLLRPEYTNVFPYTSTLEDPALAYEIRGQNEGEASVSLVVGFLTTDAQPKAENAQENESGQTTGSGEPQAQDSGSAGSEGS